MKKSTLITTIAMIVVVVVALSTATYAWFTSATKATAGDNISVTSTSGWMLAGTSQRTLEEATDTATFSYTSDIALNLPNGLYSPAAELTNKISSNGASATFTNVKFFEAFQNGIELAPSAIITEGTDSYTITEQATTQSYASYIKVRNSAAQAKNLVLTISVYTTATDLAQLAAIQNLCAYITYHDGTNAYSANTAYSYGTIAAATDPDDAEEQLEVTRHDVTASVADAEEHIAALTGNNTWTTLSDSTKLTTAFTGGDSDLTSGQYYQYKLTIPSIAVNGEVNFAMYIWFDGWRIFSTANQASAQVFLAFGDN